MRVELFKLFYIVLWFFFWIFCFKVIYEVSLSFFRFLWFPLFLLCVWISLNALKIYKYKDCFQTRKSIVSEALHDGSFTLRYNEICWISRTSRSSTSNDLLCFGQIFKAILMTTYLVNLLDVTSEICLQLKTLSW